MSRKRKKVKRRKNSSKKFAKRTELVAKTNRIARLLRFLAGSGILLVALTVTYQFFSGNISLKYVQPIGRAYEFELSNDTPSDKMIMRFRVNPPTNQQVLYEITKDTYFPLGSDGRAIPPIIYVPASEFEELDGQIIAANSSLKFRIPPLISQSWAKPNATIVDVHYQLKSSNKLLIILERTLGLIGLHTHDYNSRYLVIDNYWIPSRSKSIDEAIRVYCRENNDAVSTKICTEKR